MSTLVLRTCCPLLAVMLLAGAVTAADEEPGHSTTVGMPATIEELVLPGPLLEVKPLENRDAPFILRLVESFPHGSSHRYTFEYYALEPGGYNLTDYLRPAESGEAVELPKVLVSVQSSLPPGHIQPHELQSSELPRVGGYWVWVTLGAILWLATGYAILFVGRKKRSDLEQTDEARPKTLADRLRPSVDAAVAGELSPTELAELERVLFAFWRNRLGLNDLPAAEAMRKVLDHPESGELLRQVEVWLHHPDAGGEVDVASLLAPYRDLPADAMTEPSREAVGA